MRFNSTKSFPRSFEVKVIIRSETAISNEIVIFMNFAKKWPKLIDEKMDDIFMHFSVVYFALMKL